MPTIVFHAENHITVKHPCRITDQNVGSLDQWCTVDIVAEEYTPAIHRGIIDAELEATPYPPYGMRREIIRSVPCFVGTSDSVYVAWPPNGEHCAFPSSWIIGNNPNQGAKVLVRVSEPGFCSSLGESGPKVNFEHRYFEGDPGLPYLIYDCFDCGQRPTNTVPPP